MNGLALTEMRHIGRFVFTVGGGWKSESSISKSNPPLRSDLSFTLDGVDHTSFSFLEPMLLVSRALESLVFDVPLGPFLPSTCLPSEGGWPQECLYSCSPLTTFPESCPHFPWLPPQQTPRPPSLWLQPTPAQSHTSDAPRTRYQDVHLPSSVPSVPK